MKKSLSEVKFSLRCLENMKYLSKHNITEIRLPMKKNGAESVDAKLQLQNCIILLVTKSKTSKKSTRRDIYKEKN